MLHDSHNGKYCINIMLYKEKKNFPFIEMSIYIFYYILWKKLKTAFLEGNGKFNFIKYDIK